jgi:hypothetical protein
MMTCEWLVPCARVTRDATQGLTLVGVPGPVVAITEFPFELNFVVACRLVGPADEPFRAQALLVGPDGLELSASFSRTGTLPSNGVTDLELVFRAARIFMYGEHGLQLVVNRQKLLRVPLRVAPDVHNAPMFTSSSPR